MKIREFLILPGLFLLILALMVGCSGPGKEAGGSKDGTVSVATVQVVKGTLENGTVISGKLKALESADIVPKIAGRISEVTVDIGSRVCKGDLLLTLDAQDMSAAVSQAQASLARVRADAAMAAKSYARMKALFEQGAVSAQEMDFAESRLQTANAAVLQAEAAVQVAQATYNNSVFTAPISGVVTARNINLGEKAAPDKPVLSIKNLDTMLVEAGVNETQINNFKQGQKVSVKVFAVSEKPFSGTITNIGLAPNKMTKSYPIKIQIDNTKHILKPGMFAEVVLEADTNTEILVPREAVLTEGSDSYVFIAKDNQVEKQKVTVGRSDSKNIVVKSGLKEKEQVVVAGLDSLQDGMKVKVQYSK